MTALDAFQPARADLRRELARRLTLGLRDRLLLPELLVSVAIGRSSSARPHLVAIGRERHRIGVACQPWMIVERPNEVFHRLLAVLAIVAGAPLERFEAVADISDGEDSGPGLISFCSRDPDAILIPDPVFVRTRGYEEDRRLARANTTQWDARSDLIIWRGQTSGVGTISKPHLSADDPDLLPRVRLCLALKDVPGTDIRLTAISHSKNEALDRDRLERAGILGEFIFPIAWHGLKLAIDIDGNSNAWSNFLARLIMGCCVLKVASALGYRQWYYGDIRPWTHYVPVQADLSDLRDRATWCRENPAECRKIAARGQAFAMARDFSTEMALAARRVGDACKTRRLRTEVD
jgi:hypothetical protein